mmetsp:Transcript_73943/g.239016  ORF Transcript_73943/g.239016 Transcript_73943/m.239016 type:complete len:366 (+) Transcript_73943:1016-2113(+)
MHRRWARHSTGTSRKQQGARSCVCALMQKSGACSFTWALRMERGADVCTRLFRQRRSTCRPSWAQRKGGGCGTVCTLWKKHGARRFVRGWPQWRDGAANGRHWLVHQLVEDGQATMSCTAPLSGVALGRSRLAFLCRPALTCLCPCVRAPASGPPPRRLDGCTATLARAAMASGAGAGAWAGACTGAGRGAPVAWAGAPVPLALQWRAPAWPRLILCPEWRSGEATPGPLGRLSGRLLRWLACWAAACSPMAWAPTPVPAPARMRLHVHSPHGGSQRLRLLVSQEVAELGELGSELVVWCQRVQDPGEIQGKLAAHAAEAPLPARQRELEHPRMQEDPGAELSVLGKLRARQVLVVAHDATDGEA